MSLIARNIFSAHDTTMLMIWHLPLYLIRTSRSACWVVATIGHVIMRSSHAHGLSYKVLVNAAAADNAAVALLRRRYAVDAVVACALT